MTQDNQKRALDVIRILEKEYPGSKIALDYENPLELLVSTILSAQCTDRQVNIVTKTLFKKYKTINDYACADLKEFEQDIKSTGFYRNKSKNITEACKLIERKYNGKVPDTMDELLTLPGVARKTANIVLSNAYGVIVGIAVDTHVKRLSQRLGFSKNENPDKIEQDLIELFPKKEWFKLNYLLIEHGRKICQAKKPLCPECPVRKLCPSAKKFYKNIN